ncbi:glycosyltransferase [Blastococcus xanthinilyticus]|uniref:Glycosyl transferase family 2 n=1 Tax=Blastococcus xanthinilyticus TaxID=1564164 RepID=A0A5S5CTS9_9ACTN|nr:glycosyltransferase [Blastococcus xanthinilyticus]TYP87211.1 glycosyl transferase family 2 [Blastococcus xanthinilyticus]
MDGEFAGRRQVLEVELAEPAADGAPLCTVAGAPVTGGAATVLARLHGSPLAQTDVELPARPDHAALLELVRPRVAAEVAAHEAADAAAGEGCAAWLPLPDPAPRVTVVVPTVGREDLAGCLRSLLAQEYADFEVVVVDNAPGPERRALLDRVLASVEDPAHRVRRVVEPIPGISYARNRGLAAADGPLVAFVDDDVLVDRRWLRATVAAFDAVPGVTCVTGLVLPWEVETAEQGWFVQYGGFDKGFRRRAYDLTGQRGDSVLYPYLPGQYGTGANQAFRTAFLRELGGFDPTLGMRRPVVGGEDIDVLLRTVLAGGVLVYEPQALLWFQPYRDYRSLQRQMVIYGRGLAAVLLKAALSDRAVAADLARRVPAGLRFLLDPRSGKNSGKQGYPLALTLRELTGVLTGPPAYAWAGRNRRRADRSRQPGPAG